MGNTFSIIPNVRSKESFRSNSQNSLLNFRNGSITSKSENTYISSYSASRAYSRSASNKLRNRVNEYTAFKTSWPVSNIEALFLPEFKIRGKHEFQLLQEISKGAYGKVYKAKRNDSNEQYFAVKVISKSQIIKENAVKQVKEEVAINVACGHNPFIVSCSCYWQNRTSLFIVTEYINGGELFKLISDYGPLPEPLVQIYVAQLATAIDYLHNMGVIYRDLKAENILLDDDGNLRIIDFGLSKWLSIGSRTSTMCGTVQYIAPEMLRGEMYNHGIDWWSLGVLTCLLLTSQFPIIDNGFVKLPSNVQLTERSIDLLQRLLSVDPSKRLRSLFALKTVAFFHHFNFKDISTKKIIPRDIILSQCNTVIKQPLHFQNFDNDP